MTTETGWAEMPGGSLLGTLIADAFDRATRHDQASAHTGQAPHPTEDDGDDHPALLRRGT